MKCDCYNPALIIKLKEIMGLKNVRLLPDDRLAYILYNSHWDMRDVEAALEIEENFGIELLPYMTDEKAYLDLSLSDLMMLIGKKRFNGAKQVERVFILRFFNSSERKCCYG